MNITFLKSALDKKELRYEVSRLSLVLKHVKKNQTYILKILHITVRINSLHVFTPGQSTTLLVCGVLFFFFLVRYKITSRYSA